MRQRTAITLALAFLIALALAALTTTSRVRAEERTVGLSPGCNMVTLTFATGTGAATLTTAVSPPEALDAVWRLDNATRTFQAFMPQAPQASDLTSLNLLDAAFICVDAAATIAMPTVASDPASAPISVNLSTGCSAVGLTFLDGTAPSGVAGAITPAGAFESLWRLDNATGSFQAYVAAAPQASDLTSLAFLDAVFICTVGPATLMMPAVTTPSATVPTGPPGDVRYVMEAAVPQIVDLPQAFQAVYEDFESYSPPGLLYYYDILYGDPLGYDAPFETPAYIAFDLALFDTVGNAKSAMQQFRSLSAEEWKTELQPRYGGSFGLEIDSVTIQEVEALTAIGEEAAWSRFRLYLRPVQTNDFFLPFATDVITIRRDRILGRVWVDWSWGPPGPKFIPENLAKKMDAGIQEALPELLAAVQ